MNPLLHFEMYGVKEGRYREEIFAIMPAILTRYPECRNEFNGGILKIRLTDNSGDSMDENWLYEICKPLYDKIDVLLISGGDEKERYKYLKFISENFPKLTVAIESNGVEFNENFQKLACENIFNVNISINFSNADILAQNSLDEGGKSARKIYDSIPDNIKSYISKLELENKIYFAPTLSMFIGKENYFDVENFVELALNLHAQFAKFFFDEYFSNPENNCPALKTLMELERVFADKFLIYFKSQLPDKNFEIIRQEVEATPIEILKEKYAKILELAKNRSIVDEHNKRNEFRRAVGKNELSLEEDFSPTLKLTDKNISLDLYPDGQIKFGGLTEPTLNIKNFMNADEDFVAWDSILNSFEYASARYKNLNCPMKFEPLTKYNLERKTDKKICACCGNEIKNYSPLEGYVDLLKKNGVKFNFRYEMLNLSEYSCPICGSADRERAFALVMKKILPTDKKINILDIAPRKCITDFVKKNFPLANYKTADLFMPEADYKLDICDMKEIADGSIDFFICSHVLEHVPNDIKAMQELKRILSAKGCGILIVPLNLNQAEIDEDPNCTDIAERWRRFAQDDHVRAYTKAAFLQRLESVGLKFAQYDKNFFGKDLMAENGLIDTSVVYVVRK